MMLAAANNTPEMECPQCGAPVEMPEYADAAVCSACGSTLARDRSSVALSELGPVSAGVRQDGEAGPGRAAEDHVLHSVQCSQCAGPLSAFEGRRILVCSHCGVRVMVKEHAGFTRWYFPSRLDRLRAAAAAAAWLRDYPGVAKNARSARVIETQLLYAPIWEHRCLLAGWEFGQKVRLRQEIVRSAVPTVSISLFGGPEAANNEQLELVEVKEAVKEPRLLERRFYQPATDFEAFGAVRPRVTGRELLVPLLAGEVEPFATVIEAGGSPAEIAASGQQMALVPLSGARDADSHLFTFRESLALLYYPMWVVVCQAGDRQCRLVVNGRDGTVNSAVAPAANEKRVALLVLQAVFAAVLIAFFTWIAATREAGRSSIVALAVIVFVATVVTIWRFRMVGEVQYHEPFSG